MTPTLQASLQVREFLQMEACPYEWQRMDLYLLRDEQTVFYVGQSQSAFARVWTHFYAGFKARSVMGRFIVCNWPVSMRFTIELMQARHPRFAAHNHDLNQAEQALIAEYRPCLNTTHNPNPLPLPAGYTHPLTPLRLRLHPKRCIQQAAESLDHSGLRRFIEMERHDSP